MFFLGAVQMSCPNCQDNDISNHVKNWLKHAPERAIMDKKNQEKNRSEVTMDYGNRMFLKFFPVKFIVYN